MNKIVGTLRRACKKYPLIQEGDHIAVGLSGGADSLVLLTALAEFAKYSPINFSLSAITIDMGFAQAGISDSFASTIESLTNYTSSLGIPYYVVPTSIASTVFKQRKESNPCSLCSKIRRGALCSQCKEIGANKLALAHHSEDILETFFLSFIYEGRLSTLQPYSYLERADITLIRPFIYVKEEDIKHIAHKHNMPVSANPCPQDKHTKREFMKELTNSIQKDVPFAKEHMLSAIASPKRYNLWDQFEKEKQ